MTGWYTLVSDSFEMLADRTVVYLIDGRRVLRSADTMRDPFVADWTCDSFFDEHPLSIALHPSPPFPHITSIEIDIVSQVCGGSLPQIRRLAKRANVLPVIAHADALTVTELDAVRQAVHRDLAEAFRDEVGGGFGMFGAAEDGNGRQVSHIYRSR